MVELNTEETSIVIKALGKISKNSSWGNMRQRRKYWEKRIKATQYIILHCDIFGIRLFPFKKSTKTTYYSTTFTHTINLLLLVPNHLVQEIFRM